MPFKLKKTKDQKKTIDNLLARIKELEENWKRSLADYQNLEKRNHEQQQAYIRIANASLVNKLLDILTDLERAKTHLRDEGLNLIINQFNEVLISEGVQEIETTKGKEFDPQVMECVEMSQGPENQVIMVQSKGYTLNGKLIRPAKVIVGKAK
jgi:molecular chaperone GrpE